MNSFKRKLLAIILVLTLVVQFQPLALAEADPGQDAPSASESSPTPEPAPSSSPEPAASGSPEPTVSPAPTSNFDGASYADLSDSPGSEETDYYIDDDEKERRWQEYQTWLASQNPGAQESSGGVDYSGNVGDTTIDTGDATAAGAVVTSVNTTAVTTGGNNCSACAADTGVTNSGNGSGSDNTAVVNNNNNTAVVINNDANVENNLDFDANSGYNEASSNVGESEIFTGDANVVLTVITEANMVGIDVLQFDLLGNQNGDVILDGSSALAQNIGNGSGSTNNATVNNTSSNVETVNNDGDIVNNIDIDANTGYNDASKNTGGDSTIETGNANIVVNVVNSLNTVVEGAMNVVNIFGDMVGNIVQPTIASSTSDCSCQCSQDVTAANTGNGSDSTNNSNVNNTNTNTTNMTNNANVENNLDLHGSTGGNTASDNTGGSSTIDSGNVSVDANVINIANINVAAGSCDPIYFVFINDVDGQSWQGQILGAVPGTYFYTSDGSIFFVDQNGQLVAMNTGNGADSTNNATVNNTNTNTTNITNNGNVTNNINIDANTGYNEANKNTGGNSTITTGDANIVVNVINFINSNFSGRKVVMTLVNVFGSWLGNFVPAGYAGPVGGPSASSEGSSSSSSNNTSNVSSNGGGENTVSVGSQTIATVSATGNAFKTLVLGSSNFQGPDIADADSTDSTVAQYKVVGPQISRGIPVALSIIILLAFLGVATIVLRRRIALVVKA